MPLVRAARGRHIGIRGGVRHAGKGGNHHTTGRHRHLGPLKIAERVDDGPLGRMVVWLLGRRRNVRLECFGVVVDKAEQPRERGHVTTIG